MSQFARTTCALIALLLPFACASSRAQESEPNINSYQAISGKIVDAQDRGIAGATIDLSQEGSSSAIKVATDREGRFSLVELTPARYYLKASAKGFQTLARTIEVGNLEGPELVLKLDVGAVQSTITVQGDHAGIVETETSAGSLAPISLMDLPQSVQVVSRELLDEQKAYRYSDAATYMAGVQRAYTAIAGSLGDELAMRGFNLDFQNNYLRDGYKFYGLSLSDTADIESVELLKGPASALYGTAEAGGIVNLITKKPTETPYFSASMNGGSYQYLRPDFDISGPLNRTKSLYYRLNGVYENAQSFRQYIGSVKYFIAPYLLWKPSSATSLALQGEWVNVDRNSDYGLALLGSRPAPVSVSTSYTEPWNSEEDRDRQGGYRFSHSFNRNWTLTNGLQISRSNARYVEVYTTGADAKDPTLLTRLSDEFYFPTLFRYSQTALIGNFKTGALVHHAAVGFEAGWVTASSEGPGGYAPSVSVLHPVVGTDFSRQNAITALANPYFSLTYETYYHNQSGFLQDQVDLGSHWKAIGGVRIENFYQDSLDQSTNTHQKQTDLPVSPRAGIVYQPTHAFSLYGSYVRSFIPTTPSATNSVGKQFSPEYDHQWEGGLKLAPNSSRLTATIAVFQIEKNNVLAPDASNPIFSVQNGQERSKGVEFELMGSPVHGLNLLSSYAFIQAQVTKSTEYPVGNLLPNAPRNSGAMWATYQAPEGVLRQIGVSAGVTATGARQDNFYNTALLPGYARVDLGAFYERNIAERQTLRFNLNIQNALDRTYYLASNGQDQVRPGSPVSVLAGLSWTWR